MAKIHYMKDKNGNTIYPVTHADAILGLEDVGSNIDLSSYQTKVDNNLVTQSKDLVEAINELFQSANNGKQIIADAIGSPLSSDDTFAAMGNSIDTMTIDFRNALALKGVNAPADKFETLINRIDEIVQSGNVLNNQVMVSGEYTLGDNDVIKPNSYYESYATPSKASITIANLEFTPEYYVVYIPDIYFYEQSSIANQQSIPSYLILTPDKSSVVVTGGNAYQNYQYSTTFSIQLTSNSIILDINGATNGIANNYYSCLLKGSTIKWYAIGSSQLPNNGGERTITPSTSDQVLPDGYYSGDITVKGDSDLIPENILEGVEIFGVTGNVKQGSVFPEWYKKGSYAPFTSLPVGGWDIGSCVCNDDIYAFYGSNAYCLDMNTGIWRTITPMPTTRSGPSATCVGDKIYVIGGYSNTNNECYDPATNTWTTKTSRDGTGTSRNVVYNNIIYFFGNKNAYLPPKCYDPVTDTWTVKSGGPANKTTLDNTVGLINDMIYFIGQYTTDPFMYIYDPKTEAYTTRTLTNSYYRYYAGSAVYNNIFYFFCGYGRYSCYAYDPINNTSWEIELYPSGQALEHISSVVYKNYIINLGGEYYTDGRSYERTHCIAFIPE